MIRIALCGFNIIDDIESEIDKAQLATTMNLASFQVAPFELWFKIQDKRISEYYADIFVLNLDNTEEKMFELCGVIQKKALYPIIIGISVHSELALDGYRYGLYRFILRSDVDIYLRDAIVNALTSINHHARPSIVVTENHDFVEIPLCDILYIQKEGRKVYVHTHTQVLQTNHTLTDVETRLCEKEFFRIDRSTIVNILHVIEKHSDYVVMRNGDRFFLSKSRCQDFYKKVSDFRKKDFL